MTDAELLDQHRQGSPDAFAQIVQRHINWVHSVARRRVRDDHLAEDVTQAAFMTLARKPPRLWPGSPLSPWLMKVVILTCKAAQRNEFNRRHRETEAAKMRSESTETPEAAHWNEISPHVDELVEQLGNSDRSAVMLRFYEQKSFSEVGEAMGISEEAARKRVSRAIEKLRVMMVSKGATIPTTALAGLLLAEACKPAPPALAAQLTSTIVSTAAVPAASSAFTLSKGVITMMTISKIKLTAAAIFAAIVLVGGGVLVTAQIVNQRQPAPAPNPQQAAAPATWRERFDRVYRLEDKEVLKLITPPFIPERDQFFQEIIAGRGGAGGMATSVPDYLDLQWVGGRLQMRSYGSAQPGRMLNMVLTGTLGLKTYEFDCPPALLTLPIAGDWIARPDANIADKLQFLAAMLTNATGKLVQVESKSVEREVLVASGELRPDAANTVVHFEDVQLPGNGAQSGGGGGMVFGGRNGPAKGSVQAFLDVVAQSGGMIVINETKSPATSTMSWDRFFHWQQLSMMPDGPDKQALLQGRIESLKNQTGLKFTVEKRKVDVWQFTQAP